MMVNIWSLEETLHTLSRGPSDWKCQEGKEEAWLVEGMAG
jgi:hypothetical protein